MVEGTDGFFGEPPPDGAPRDLSHEAPRNHLPSHFRRAPATRGDPATSRKLASQRLQLYPHRRGERSGVCPSVVDPPVHLTPPRGTACAIWRPFEGWCKASGRSPCWRSLRRPKARSLPAPPPSEERCGRRLACAGWGARLWWVRCGTDFGWAYKFSLLSDTTATKTLPRKENASKKFRQRPLRNRGRKPLEAILEALTN
jgi:hypothetical protein